MTTKTTILRWATVTISSLCALTLFLQMTLSALRGAAHPLALLFFTIIVALPFLLITYFGVRGEYRKLLDVVFFYTSLILWVTIVLGLQKLRIPEWVREVRFDDWPPLWSFLLLFFNLAATIGLLIFPFFAAIRAFRFMRDRRDLWLIRRDTREINRILNLSASGDGDAKSA